MTTIYTLMVLIVAQLVTTVTILYDIIYSYLIWELPYLGVMMWELY